MAEPGPIFVCGRQHCGNTVTAYIFGMVPDCLSVNVEGLFFEYRGIVERMKDPVRRANKVVDLLRFEDADLLEKTRTWLVGWHREHPDVTAVEVYREAMRYATEADGKRFWVRRATSYIFYVEEIMNLMPEVRVLYLLRNPYDMTASRKRRAPSTDLMWSPALSWNRGLRIADRMQRRVPDRFRIVRYEDLATKPVESFAGVFAFLGLPFDEAYLDVPHINRAEAYQTRTSKSRGMVASRVNYYPEVLNPAQIAAMDMLAWQEKVREYYPDLPHQQSQRAGLGTRVRALGIVAMSPVRYLLAQIGLLFRKNPVWRIRRTLHRLRIAAR